MCAQSAASPHFDAILFDLGDTLIDFEPMDTRAVFRQAAAQTYRALFQRGYSLPPFDQYCRAQFRSARWAYLRAKFSRREFNSLDLLDRFCRAQRLPIDLQHNAEALRELAWQWYQPVTEHTRVEPDAAATLEELRTCGWKLGVVSNTFIPGAVMDRHLEMFDLLRFFPVRIYSSEVRYRKPSPRIFEIALSRLQVSAAQTVFVGDLLKTDMRGAQRSGLTAVLKQRWGLTQSHHSPEHIIEKLSDLPALLEKLSRQRRNPPQIRRETSPAPDADMNAPIAADIEPETAGTPTSASALGRRIQDALADGTINYGYVGDAPS